MSTSSPQEKREPRGERRSGGDRRREGRIVYSRGPIILALEIASAVSSIFAVVAIVISLILFLSRNGQLVTSEEYANYETCHLIVSILDSFHTPRGEASARAILALNPQLRDCHAYAKLP